MRQIFHLLGILFHLMSRDGGKLIDFHPKVESFHLFRLQCRRQANGCIPYSELSIAYVDHLCSTE